MEWGEGRGGVGGGELSTTFPPCNDPETGDTSNICSIENNSIFRQKASLTSCSLYLIQGA
jgi:hypothetical protein